MIEAARRRLEDDATRTCLFIDEIHRFNKAQQDVLLPLQDTVGRMMKKALASVKGTEPYSSDLRDLTMVSGLAIFLPFTTKLLLAATDGESVVNQEAFAAAAARPGEDGPSGGGRRSCGGGGAPEGGPEA